MKLLGEQSAIADAFYWTGGTVLAEIYLHHRYSEDLDFFSERDVDVEGITSMLTTLKAQTGFRKLDIEQSFNRNLFFLDFGDETLKMEFTYFPFPRIEAEHQYGELSIDSLIDIAVNKLFTIYQKPRARDFIDLYSILKKEPWQMADLIAKAKIKFDWHVDPLQLGSQFLRAREVKDYPRMITVVSDEAWMVFFEEAARSLEHAILDG